jgi:intracellular septation protein
LNTHNLEYGYLIKKINKKILKFFYSVNIFSVNKSFIKFITDFGPLLVFFSFYYKSEKNLSVAIPPFIVATLIALIVMWILEKKIPMVPLLGGIFITLFGGLTIYFDNPIFIYIKPTIINILFGITLLLGKFFTNEPILKKMLGKSLQLSDEGWKILNLRWVYFFFGLALLNELVWRTQSEEFWVNFKVWGILPLTIIFTGFQISIINKYKLNE